MLKKILCVFAISAFLTHQACADDIKIIGTINTTKFIKNTYKSHSMTQIKPEDSSITLFKLELSQNALNTINKRAQRTQGAYKFQKPQTFNMPAQVELGMNNVPVLNQGAHGSCVVFAVTEALDAIINKGDYVSQVCQLSLGRYIENNGYIPSGWNGTFARNILSELELFGFVSKNSQQTHGCAGLTEYPESGEDLLNEVSVEEFHKLSEKLLANKISWTSILDIFQAAMDSVNESSILLETKKALLAGDRIVMGVILLDYEKGVVGAQGTHRAKNDTWVLTPEMISGINDQQNYAGHALLITGYNDEAIAMDTEGRPHRGLLTLRNSWGSRIGDAGDFYMSYDYFKTLALEAQRVRHLQ